jgi:hypothetical protein
VTLPSWVKLWWKDWSSCRALREADHATVGALFRICLASIEEQTPGALLKADALSICSKHPCSDALELGLSTGILVRLGERIGWRALLHSEQKRAAGLKNAGAQSIRMKHLHKASEAQKLRSSEKRFPPVSPLTGGAHHPPQPEEFRDDAKPPPKPRPPSTPKRRPADPWTVIAARPVYDRLWAHADFLAAWREWVDHCETQGTRARTPAGPRCAAMLNEALQVGPAKYAAALRAAITRNWLGPCIEAVERQSKSPSGFTSKADAANRECDAFTERALRNAGFAVDGDPEPPTREAEIVHGRAS